MRKCLVEAPLLLRTTPFDSAHRTRSYKAPSASKTAVTDHWERSPARRACHGTFPREARRPRSRQSGVGIRIGDVPADIVSASLITTRSGKFSLRLHHSRPTDPGHTRLCHGRGFRYLDTRGEPLRDPAELGRTRALVIPPAWRDVWMKPMPCPVTALITPDLRGQVFQLFRDLAALRGRISPRAPQDRRVLGADPHRRFTECTAARVWVKLHRVVLDELGSRGGLDWSRCAIDSVNMRALKGGTDRSKSRRPGQERLEDPLDHRAARFAHHKVDRSEEEARHWARPTRTRGALAAAPPVAQSAEIRSSKVPSTPTSVGRSMPTLLV